MTTVTITIEQTPAGLEIDRTLSKDNETYLEDWYTTKLLAVLEARDEALTHGKETTQ